MFSLCETIVPAGSYSAAEDSQDCGDAECHEDLQQTCYEAVCDMMWTQGLSLCSSSCLQDAIVAACALITADKVRTSGVQ